MTYYSTSDVALIIGVSRSTLHRWLREGKLSEPMHRRNGRATIREWGIADLQRAWTYRQRAYRGQPSDGD